MIPTPQRLRSARCWWAGFALFLGGGLAVGAWFLPASVPIRIAGVCVCGVLGAAIYRRGMRRWRRRLVVAVREFPSEWDRILRERVEFYAALDDAGKDRFRLLTSIFLDETRITGVDVEIDDTCRLLVAASAVIPIFGFPVWEYSMLDEVLVFPGQFDPKAGPHGGDRPEVLGMVGDTGGAFNGLMVLSKPNLYAGFARAHDKHNVGIHEFAHLVDKGDGAIDGVPPGLPAECITPWLQVVREELDSRQDARGRPKRGRSDIPRYGDTNEQEFFAVAAEYFFESPEKLAERHPELYALLERAFRQKRTFSLRRPGRLRRSWRRRMLRRRRDRQ